jgi:hypothetical protein
VLTTSAGNVVGGTDVELSRLRVGNGGGQSEGAHEAGGKNKDGGQLHLELY